MSDKQQIRVERRESEEKKGLHSFGGKGGKKINKRETRRGLTRLKEGGFFFSS